MTKYQGYPSLEAHLKQTSVQHLSPVYLVMCPSRFERRKHCKKIVEMLKEKHPHAQALTFDATKAPFETILGELETLSLFKDRTLIFLDEIDQLKKATLDALVAYVKKPSPFSHLVLGCASVKQAAPLTSLEGLVAFDLSGEKPWERKKRLAEEFRQLAQSQGKTIAADLIEFLVEESEEEGARGEQELLKLAAFAGEKPHLDLKDAMLLCKSAKEVKGWDIAEALVWEEDYQRFEREEDVSSALALAGQVRYHLQLGRQIILLDKEPAMKEGSSSSNFLKPAMIAKYSSRAKRRSLTFFENALIALFDAEVLLRNSALSPKLFLEMLAFKFHRLKTDAQK
ncbi:MAG: DNA polymerase III subunit delta [Anaerolineae bacterium]